MTELEKLRRDNQMMRSILAAVAEYHGGWIVLDKSDFIKVDPHKTLLVSNGPAKGSIMVRLV